MLLTSDFSYSWCFVGTRIIEANGSRTDGRGPQVPYQGLSHADTLLWNRQRGSKWLGNDEVSLHSLFDNDDCVRVTFAAQWKRRKTIS